MGDFADRQTESVLWQEKQNREILQREISEDTENQAKKEVRRKTVIRVVIALAIIIVGVFLTLFLISKAARFDSVGSMLDHMWGELQLMGERVFDGSYPRGDEWMAAS